MIAVDDVAFLNNKYTRQRNNNLSLSQKVKIKKGNKRWEALVNEYCNDLKKNLSSCWHREISSNGIIYHE